MSTRPKSCNPIQFKIRHWTSLSKSDRALQIHQKENMQHHRKYLEIYRNIADVLFCGILQACCLARLSSSMPATHIPWTKLVSGLKHVCKSRCWVFMFVAIAESKLKHDSTIQYTVDQDFHSLSQRNLHQLCHKWIAKNCAIRPYYAILILDDCSCFCENLCQKLQKLL